MNKINIQNIYEVLDSEIPEFKNYENYSMWYKSNPGLHIGNFAFFVVKQIEEDENEEQIKKSFDFINDALNNDRIDESLKGIFDLQILETLADSRRASDMSKKLLKDQALVMFNLQLN